MAWVVWVRWKAWEAVRLCNSGQETASTSLDHLWEWVQVPTEFSRLPTSWTSLQVCLTSLHLVLSSHPLQDLASVSLNLDSKDSGSSPLELKVSDRICSRLNLHQLDKLSQAYTVSALQYRSPRGSLLKMVSALRLRSAVKQVSAVSLQHQGRWGSQRSKIYGSKHLDSSQRINRRKGLVSKLSRLPTHTCKV